MTKLIGTADTLESMQPGIIGSFFGGNVLYFSLSLDEPTSVGGKELATVPVKAETYYRLPNFSGYKIAVSGKYDDYDDVFRADFISVDSLGVAMGAVKRHSLLGALGRIVASYVVVAIGIILVQFLSSYAISNVYVDVWPALLAIAIIAASILVLIMLVWVVTVFVVQSSLGTVAEHISRFVRSFTEHQAHST